MHEPEARESRLKDECIHECRISNEHCESQAREEFQREYKNDEGRWETLLRGERQRGLLGLQKEGELSERLAQWESLVRQEPSWSRQAQEAEMAR